MITITATAETAVGNPPDMNGTFMNVIRNFHLPYLALGASDCGCTIPFLTR